MSLNLGYVELGNDTVRVRVYYDNTVGPDQPQALVNGPRGYCLDLTNLSGRNRALTVSVNGQTVTINVGQGDPVSTGPASGRSRTAAEMSALGLSFRSDLHNLTSAE